jgi:hypothetical protein
MVNNAKTPADHLALAARYDKLQARLAIVVARFVRRTQTAMGTSLKAIRDNRAIVALLLVVWLPYVSTRCIGGFAHEGCTVFPTSGAGPIGDAHGDRHMHRHEHAAGHTPGSSDHGEHPSDHTCCELTGKFAFAPAASAPSPAPLAVLVTLRGLADHLKPRTAVFVGRRVLDPTHHPPPYLRFGALLI